MTLPTAAQLPHGARLRPTADATPLREVRGVVERLTYQDAGMTEAARGDDRLITLVGALPEVLST